MYLPTRPEKKEPRLPTMPTPATSIGSTFSGDEPVRRLPRDGAPALHRKPIPRPVLVPADQLAHVEALGEQAARGLCGTVAAGAPAVDDEGAVAGQGSEAGIE